MSCRFTNFKKISVAALTLLLVSLGCDNLQSDNDQKTIILAHAMHLTHPVTIAMDRMAELVDEKSGGKLKIEIYPTGQLGGERELLELVQIGTIGITKVSGAVLENTVPPMQVLSLPYLFRDDEHFEKVLWGDVGRDLLLEGEKYRLRGIAYYDAGMRSFYSVDKPINTPADLAGMKIRVQPSVMAIRLISAYGGAATPLAYGELYTAFQGGIVDGAENNPPSFYTSRHYEVTNYYTLNEHTAVPDVLVIGTSIWDNLSDEEREWLTDGVNESVEFQRELWKESEEESLRIVEEAGVEVSYPNKEPFREKVQHIYDDVEETKPDLYRWVERIQKVQ